MVNRLVVLGRNEVLMKEKMVTGIDISVEEHEELNEKLLQKRLKKSIRQSKDGKVKSRGSFAEHVR